MFGRHLAYSCKQISNYIPAHAHAYTHAYTRTHEPRSSHVSKIRTQKSVDFSINNSQRLLNNTKQKSNSKNIQISKKENITDWSATLYKQFPVHSLPIHENDPLLDENFVADFQAVTSSSKKYLHQNLRMSIAPCNLWTSVRQDD